MRTIFKEILLLCLLAFDTFPLCRAQDINHTLDSLFVRAKGTGLKVKDNIITYDISSDSLLRLKSMRVLVSSMPLVTYEQTEGKLRVNGSDNIIILLNGRRSLVVNSSNFRYISEFIKGKELESLSIDIAPTGMYSGYSAVINIVSKSLLSNFYSGSLSLFASSAYNVSPSAAFTSSFGKLTENISYKYSYDDLRPSWNYTEKRTAEDSSTGMFIASDTTKKKKTDRHEIKLELSYDVTPDDIIFFTSSGNFADSRTRINSFSQIEGRVSSLSNTNRYNEQNGGGSLAYQHLFDKRNQKTLTFQYSLDIRENNNLYGINTENSLTNIQNTVSSDYLHTISRTANWNVNTTWFARCYVSKSPVSTLLSHNQDVLQTQINSTKQLGKLRIMILAAYDFTSDRANFNNKESHLKDSYGLFRYSARLQWFPHTGHIIRFNISKDIYRPDITVRNPYKDDSTPGIVFQGNPMLSNQKSNSMTLSYMYLKGSKYSLNIMTAFNHSSNGVFATTRTLEDGRLLYTYENGIKCKKLFISTNFMWRPLRNMTVNAAYRLGWNKFDFPNNSTSYIDHFVMFNAQWQIWEGGELSINASLTNPSIISSSAAQSTRIHYIVDGFIRLYQNIGRGWFAGLSIGNPWYTRHNIITEYETEGKYYYSKNSKPGMTVRASIRYNFGRFKSGVKRNSQYITDTDRSK